MISPPRLDVAGEAPEGPAATDHCLRTGLLAIRGDDRSYHLRCLACSSSQDSPVCAIAIRLAQASTRHNPVGSASHDDFPIPSPAQVSAAATYVGRIPDAAQQGYAEAYLAWALAGKPEGCQPLLGRYGLSLAAGEHLAATIERLLGRTRPRPKRRRR